VGTAARKASPWK